MAKIDLLMATYNGQLYVENQILSLLSQTFLDWLLYIHDDGSSDETVRIVKKYQKIDNRIIIIEDNITFGNAGGNFLHLLKFSNSDYIIFCDQDDIWFENKLSVLYEHIAIQRDDIPCGVYSGGYLYHNSANNLSEIETLKPRCISEQLFLNAGLQGCAVLFNRRCREIMKCYKGHISMHDHLLTMVLLTFGKIKYLNDKLMLYRQGHVGKVTENIELNPFKKRIKSLFSEMGVLEKGHFMLTNDFYNNYKDQVSSDNKEIFYAFFDIVFDRNRLSRVVKVMYNGFSLGGKKFGLIAKCLLRPILK